MIGILLIEQEGQTKRLKIDYWILENKEIFICRN